MTAVPTTLKVRIETALLKISLTGGGAPDLVSGGAVQRAEVALLPFIYCMTCDPVPGSDGSDGRRFLGKTETCPAPAECIASPSGAFLD